MGGGSLPNGFGVLALNSARRTWHDAQTLQGAWPDAQHQPSKRSGGPGFLERSHGPDFAGGTGSGTHLAGSGGAGAGKPDAPLSWLMLHIRLAHPWTFALDSTGFDWRREASAWPVRSDQRIPHDEPGTMHKRAREPGPTRSINHPSGAAGQA